MSVYDHDSTETTRALVMTTDSLIFPARDDARERLLGGERVGDQSARLVSEFCARNSDLPFYRDELWVNGVCLHYVELQADDAPDDHTAHARDVRQSTYRRRIGQPAPDAPRSEGW